MYTFKLHYPLDMNLHRKSQGFGENPASYAKFGLKGHNGIDWYPVDGRGHEVYPTDIGTVIKLYNDPTGYGYGVRLRHSWGESVYGHFVSTPNVKLGATVQLNTVLGIEDSTGYSTGTHLHFGVYPLGESSSNGYSGAVNPELVGFYPYSPTDHSGGVTPSPSPSPSPSTEIKAGKVTVLPLIGLRLRTEPSTIAGRVLMTLAYGTQFNVSGETKTDGNIVWRKVELWVAESEGGEKYISNV